MIKVYAVGFTMENGKVLYTTPKSRFHAGWRSHWHWQYNYDTCPDISEAKHYETKGRAMSVIRSLCKHIAKTQTKLNSELKDTSGPSWRKEQIQKRLDSIAVFKKDYSNMSVFEYEIADMDESNTNKVERKRLKFHKNYNGTPIHNSSHIITETTSRHHCKCCGLILKNIPQVRLGGIFGGVICVRCAMTIGAEAKRSWDSLPDKEALEKEFFVHNLG